MQPGALLAGLALALAPSAVADPDPFPRAAAAYLVSVDGRVVWERAADVPRAPASLTKIMTALVILDRDFDAAETATVSPRAAAASGARLGLRAGQRWTVGDLLTAMLVRSANDACLALAEHAAGDVDTFVARMNERAAALNLRSTHFTNPCGFDATGHRSSARDLWQLTAVALEHPAFAHAVRQERARVRATGGPWIELNNSNALLGRLPGAIGVKTGFTHEAGKCVAAAAERSGVRVLAVLLDSEDRWWAAAALIERAFALPREPR